MSSKRGFTLIELLSVIVIMAIIALIAVPLVLNIIEKSKEGSFKNSVYGIMKASEYEYSKNIMNTKPFKELVFEYNDHKESSNMDGYQLEYNGKKPESGTLIIRENGEIALALFDGVYCAKKTYEDKVVSVNKAQPDECMLDLEKPSIEILGSNPFYIEVDSTNPGIYEDPGFIALNIDESPSDNVAVEIYKENISVNEIDTSELGTYQIIYTVTEAGKVDQANRIVIVRDTTPPVLTVPLSTTINTSDVSNYDFMEGVLVTDNSGEVIPVTTAGNLSIIPGSYTITYRAADSSENHTEVERVITVQDNEAPVIDIIGDNPVTINVGSIYTDAGSTAQDDVDGDITSSIITTGSVNPNIPGTYQITYTVTDSSNNIATAIRTVNVIDNVPPVITFGTNGNGTWSKNHSTTISVIDTHSEIDSSSLRYLVSPLSSGITENDITNVFSNDGTINLSTQTGDYYIWVSGKDTAENIKIERSNVFKIDNTPPVVSNVASGIDSVTANSFRITRSGDATDNHSGLKSSPYIYQTSTNGISWTTECINNSTTCNVDGLEPEATYIYRICVSDNVSNQSCVVSKSVTTANLSYTDGTGAPIPELSEGMIPITWNGNAWIKADTQSAWYNYGNKEWANAVLLNDEVRGAYQLATPGTLIEEGDVLAYLVWIPRYRYQLFNVQGDAISPQTINVEFENKTTTKSNGKIAGEYANGQWYTHPAFTFGKEELNGFWVGKFETTGTASVPTIKPGVTSLRSQTASAQFATAKKFNGLTYGLTEANNAHMMKNTEWGAVAYLSSSIYGKNSDIWPNPNNGYITGCAGTSTGSTSSSTCYTYTTPNGVQASTTGNVYGIYDMSGGAADHVMGALYNSTNTSIIIASSQFSSEVINSEEMAKYLDKYRYRVSNSDYGGFILGDATSETRGWYSDTASFIDGGIPWFYRGGFIPDGSKAGIFHMSRSSGLGGSTYSFRVVVLGGVN